MFSVEESSITSTLSRHTSCYVDVEVTHLVLSGRFFLFEVIVGLNGRIWVAASSVEDAFLIAKVFAVDVVKC